MNYKKQIRVLLVVFFLIPALSFVVTSYPTEFGLCKRVYESAEDLWGSRICIINMQFFQPLFFLSAVFFIFLIPLYFLKEAIYLSWRKFALWYLPIVGIILMLSSLNSGGNGFNPGYGFDTESLTFFFSGLFALISLLIIAVKSYKLRGK